MFPLLLLYFTFVGTCYANTEADVKAWFMELGMQCSKDYSITPDDIQGLTKHVLPDNPNVKCFLACVYRKANWLDSKGMFDVENAHAMAEKQHMNDKDVLKKSRDLFDTCKKVNEESVSDGDKGCDRSGHLYKCLTENAAKMGFNIQ